MAPPAEDAATKVVKVATSVMRRQSVTDTELRPEATPTQVDELPLSALEECLSNPRILSSLEGRSDGACGRQDETAFLARLDSLWKGFVNMPSVAKFVTKVYPVSGILDHLTEDLPDSIQVGGRISPQMVWDYVEKIRASGTKEVCLIRFTPVTEEDEISYTLLYAYFSSRRRYGVVANNTKQVKDTYLVPLGCAEKIPHQLVPFDGPGLEASRPNLLLGLIIRQRVKRDYATILPMGIPEISAPRLVPENQRAKGDPATIDGEGRHDKNSDGFNPLSKEGPVEAAKPQKPAPAEGKPGKEGGEEGDALAGEAGQQDPIKPLRFLPGVLVGGEGPSAPSYEAGSRPASAVGEVLSGEAEKDVNKQAVAATSPADGTNQGPSPTKSPAPNGPRLDRFVIKKKEPKTVKTEPLPPSPNDKPNSSDPPRKEDASVGGVLTSVVSLKDKPPDVSTEVFLAKLSQVPAAKEPGNSCTLLLGSLANEAKPSPIDAAPVVVPDPLPKDVLPIPVSLPSPTNSPRQQIGGILKNISVSYRHEKQGFPVNSNQGHNDEKRAEKVVSAPQGHSQVFNVPVLNADKQCLPRPTPSSPGNSDGLQKDFQLVEDIQTISTVLSYGKSEEHSFLPRPGIPLLALPPPTLSQGALRPPAPPFPSLHVGLPKFQYHPLPSPIFHTQSGAVPPFQPLHQSMPPGLGYPGGPPLMFSQLEPQVQNHALTWPPPAPALAVFPPQGPSPLTSFTPHTPTLTYEASRFVESSKPQPLPAKDEKGPERRHSDPWEKHPRHSEDDHKRESSSEHYSRHRHHSESHQERTGWHRDRDHDKEWDRRKHRHRDRSQSRTHSRSRSRSRRRYEEKHCDVRSRHYSEHHSQEDKRKDCRHSDDHSTRHRDKDRERHRSDSDHDKGRKRSKEKSKDRRS
ncbi:hypothetical protein AAFF_G00174510 [Aldrovandia affinis]|uniref:Spen paralogue and orthologue SPOC C-terminal domain-containing protein n=1 Tax=Aldrovandia affinis TaxID=143900 RepID=A0AAD7W844_9TELE|nr:hypothetical protein AAFF_G00174510 [Aldrovandia affinis]